MLDLLVVGLAAGAGWLGFRMGFVRRAFSWAGLALGLSSSVLFVSDAADLRHSSPPRTRLLCRSASRAARGHPRAGGGLHDRLGIARPHAVGAGVQQADRIAGAALGVFGVFLVMWLLIPRSRRTGWPARHGVWVRGRRRPIDTSWRPRRPPDSRRWVASSPTRPSRRCSTR